MVIMREERVKQAVVIENQETPASADSAVICGNAAFRISRHLLDLLQLDALAFHFNLLLI